MTEKHPKLDVEVLVIDEHNRPYEPIQARHGRYVASYVNEHGEQLVYVHDQDQQPALYHSDMDWQPVDAQQAGRGGAIILADAEILFVHACLEASWPFLPDTPLEEAKAAIASGAVVDTNPAVREAANRLRTS